MFWDLFAVLYLQSYIFTSFSFFILENQTKSNWDNQTSSSFIFTNSFLFHSKTGQKMVSNFCRDFEESIYLSLIYISKLLQKKKNTSLNTKDNNVVIVRYTLIPTNLKPNRYATNPISLRFSCSQAMSTHRHMEFTLVIFFICSWSLISTSQAICIFYKTLDFNFNFSLLNNIVTCCCEISV